MAKSAETRPALPSVGVAFGACVRKPKTPTNGSCMLVKSFSLQGRRLVAPMPQTILNSQQDSIKGTNPTIIAKSLLAITLKGRGEDAARQPSFVGCGETMDPDSAQCNGPAERRAESRGLLRVVRAHRLSGAGRLTNAQSERLAMLARNGETWSRDAAGWAMQGAVEGGAGSLPQPNFRRACSADDADRLAPGDACSCDELSAAAEGPDSRPDGGAAATGGGGSGDDRPRDLAPPQQQAAAVIAAVAASASSPSKPRGPGAASGSPKGGGAAGRGAGGPGGSGSQDGAGDGGARKRRAVDRLREDPAPKTNAITKVPRPPPSRRRPPMYGRGRPPAAAAGPCAVCYGLVSSPCSPQSVRASGRLTSLPSLDVTTPPPPHANHHHLSHLSLLHLSEPQRPARRCSQALQPALVAARTPARCRHSFSLSWLPRPAQVWPRPQYCPPVPGTKRPLPLPLPQLKRRKGTSSARLPTQVFPSAASPPQFGDFALATDDQWAKARRYQMDHFRGPFSTPPPPLYGDARVICSATDLSLSHLSLSLSLSLSL